LNILPFNIMRPLSFLALGIFLLAGGGALDAQIPNDDLNLDPGTPSLSVRKPNSALANAGVGHLDDKRTLAVGDQLSFRIAEEGDEPVVVTVASSGEIDFPYVGRIPAAGRTCKSIAEQVRSLLEKSFYRKATIGLALETASTLPMGTYFVTGQVMKQGAQVIPRDREVTVAAAVLEAGGFADFADKRRVRLIRPLAGGETKRFTVDVKAVLERGDAKKDLLVQPGDYIVVPERLFNF
jgi:polysaccharide export outer membrane protein